MTKSEIGFGMIDSSNILQIWTIRKQRKQAKEALKSLGGYNDKLIKRYEYKPIKVEITYEVKDGSTS